MVRLAPEICASRSEIAHPCRGSRASVLRMRWSSVPCGRSVLGIGTIRDPLYFDKRLARLMSKCKTSATGFEDSESHRIVLDGWPRDSPFEIALATRSRSEERRVGKECVFEREVTVWILKAYRLKGPREQ